MMGITLLDGGMGQELIARSGAAPTPLWATQVMLDNPQLVQDIHTDYFSAGADIATTNSYAIHRDRLMPFGVEEQFIPLHVSACEIALRARDAHGGGLIAGSIGPTGASYRPELALDIDEGAEVYAEIAKLQAPFVDFILLETMSSIKQATGAVLGAKVSNKPVWLAITVDDADGRKLRSGEDIQLAVALAQEQGVEALLINCSTPEAVSQAIDVLDGQGLQLGAYANGFTKISEAFKQDKPTVDALESRQDLDPNNYLTFAKQWQGSGAQIIGGCCEVGPQHIALLSSHFQTNGDA